MTFRTFAKGRRRNTRGEMNSQEREYAGILDALKADGKVAWFVFESVTFKLAKDTRYTPDFLVMLADGTMEVHEVKGFMETAAFVRIKVASELYPFRFVLARKRTKKDGGGWDIKTVGEDSIVGQKRKEAA